jgi:hypothetical protein
VLVGVALLALRGLLPHAFTDDPLVLFLVLAARLRTDRWLVTGAIR